MFKTYYYYYIYCFVNFQHEKKMLEAIFGSMEPIPLADFSKLYKETGIDVDGRVAELNEIIMPAFRKNIHDTLMFMRLLPQFDQLPSKDKIALLKGNLRFFTENEIYVNVCLSNLIILTLLS